MSSSHQFRRPHSAEQMREMNNVHARASQPSNEPLLDKNSPGSDSNKSNARDISQPTKLHLVAPALMIIFFLAGVTISLGHHFYYQWLDGQIVRSTDRQQWALRFGNLFAFLAKCCFCGSGQIAFTQWLWRTVRRKYISIRGIDAAFSANESLLSFLNWEMLYNMRIGTLLAIITWCIPLITLIAPATLSVKSALARSHVVASVPVPSVPQYLPFSDSDASYAALSRWATVTPEGGHGSFRNRTAGTSDQFARLVLSTATTGQVFPIRKPFQGADSSYLVNFIAPAIKCGKSSPEVARNTTLAAVHSQGYSSGSNTTSNYVFNVSGVDFEQLTYFFSNGGLSGGYPTEIWHIGYFAMIPFEGAADDNSSHIYDYNLALPKTVTNFDEIGSSVGAKNELNLLIADHAQPTNLTVPTFITCQMWNASWTVNMTTTNNTQTIRTTRQDLLNLVEEPLRSWGNSAYHKENSTLNLNQALYTTFFLGIAKHLLGFVGAGRAPADAYPTRDEISALSDITQTVLADSAEYGTMMRNLSSLTSMLDQGASPKPLQVMIEEFSQNVTINLMSEDFFSTQILRNISRVDQITVYTYEPRNLLLAYGIATLSSLSVLIFGLYAFLSNGVSYSSSVSAIIRTTQNPDIMHVIGPQTLGSQPLPENIANTRLRFGMVQHNDSVRELPEDSTSRRIEHIGFGIEGSVTSLRRP